MRAGLKQGKPSSVSVHLPFYNLFGFDPIRTKLTARKLPECKVCRKQIVSPREDRGGDLSHVNSNFNGKLHS